MMVASRNFNLNGHLQHALDYPLHTDNINFYPSPPSSLCPRSASQLILACYATHEVTSLSFSGLFLEFDARLYHRSSFSGHPEDLSSDLTTFGYSSLCKCESRGTHSLATTFLISYVSLTDLGCPQAIPCIGLPVAREHCFENFAKWPLLCSLSIQ
jgi:hypothetical protein